MPTIARRIAEKPPLRPDSNHPQHLLPPAMDLYGTFKVKLKNGRIFTCRSLEPQSDERLRSFRLMFDCTFPAMVRIRLLLEDGLYGTFKVKSKMAAYSRVVALNRKATKGSVPSGSCSIVRFRQWSHPAAARRRLEATGKSAHPARFSFRHRRGSTLASNMGMFHYERKGSVPEKPEPLNRHVPPESVLQRETWLPAEKPEVP